MPHTPITKHTLALAARLLLAFAALSCGIAITAAPSEVCAQTRTVKRTLKEGHSVNRLMRRMGVPGKQCAQVARALRPTFDFSRRARPGDTLIAVIDRKGNLVELTYHSRKHGKFFVRRRGDKMVTSRKRQPLPHEVPEGSDASGEPAEEPPKTPRWLVPHADDADSKRLAAWLETRDETKREQLGAALEKDFGADGLRTLIGSAFKPGPMPSGVFEKRLTLADGHQVVYAVMVPDDYDPKTPAAFHISLHGRTGTGPGTCRLRWGKPQPGWIIACPTSLGGIWHSTYSQAAVEGLYRQIIRDYAIDTDRVVLGGHSNGGNGTWQLGARFPWLWSSLVTRSGAHLAREKWRANMQHLPVTLTHGTTDVHINVKHARRMVELLEAVGNTPVYYEMEGQGHEFFSELNPQILDWMGKQTRALPKRFIYNPIERHSAEHVYWLLVQQAGTVEAEISDTPDHTLVSIKSHRDPRRLELFLPESFIDLAKPLKVVLNDEEVWTGEPKRSAAALLSSFRMTGDLKRATDVWIKIR